MAKMIFNREKIRELRQMVGLSLEDLSRLTNGNLTSTTVFRIETGYVKKPRKITLDLITGVLERELDRVGENGEKLIKQIYK